MTASQHGITPPDPARLHRQSHRVLSDRPGQIDLGHRDGYRSCAPACGAAAALGYRGAGLATVRALAPAVGAVLMSASTIVVALNAQPLRRFDLRPQPALR